MAKEEGQQTAHSTSIGFYKFMKCPINNIVVVSNSATENPETGKKKSFDLRTGAFPTPALALFDTSNYFPPRHTVGVDHVD